MSDERDSTFAERGTWKPGDLKKVGGTPVPPLRREIVTEEELRTLSDEELVALIMERSSLDEARAREALSIIRGGPPEDVAYKRAPTRDR
jgi:hypothetical protein